MDLSFKKKNRFVSALIVGSILAVSYVFVSVVVGVVNIPPEPKSNVKFYQQRVCKSCAFKCGMELQIGEISVNELNKCGERCAALSGYNFSTIKNTCSQ